MDTGTGTPTSHHVTPHTPPRTAPPPVEAVDLDRKNRPGVPRERPPEPWPNSRPTPQRMTAPPSVPRHGRPNKPMPPVYGTAVPLRGLSGAIRKAAYRLPDHDTNHWLLLMLGDRVQWWGRTLRKVLAFAVPGVGLFLVARWWMNERA
jgi:hypothetical protein